MYASMRAYVCMYICMYVCMCQWRYVQCHLKFVLPVHIMHVSCMWLYCIALYLYCIVCMYACMYVSMYVMYVHVKCHHHYVRVHNIHVPSEGHIIRADTYHAITLCMDATQRVCVHTDKKSKSGKLFLSTCIPMSFAQQKPRHHASVINTHHIQIDGERNWKKFHASP